MITTATDLKTTLGSFLQKSLQEPVFVEKNKKITNVILSIDEYERLSSLEDNYWDQQVSSIESYIGKEESMRFLRGFADARS